MLVRRDAFMLRFKALIAETTPTNDLSLPLRLRLYDEELD